MSVQQTFWLALLDWHANEMGVMMMMDRQGGKRQEENMLFVRQGGGGEVAGWCRPSPAMQCWPASPNHLQAVSEGGGPEADDSQGEFSVRRRERERESRRKSERGSQRVQWCSRTQPTAELLHFSSSFSSSFPALCSLLSSFLCSSSLLFATPFLCNLGFSVISIDCSLCCLSTLLFTIHSSPFSPLVLNRFFFSSWRMEWEISFNTCTLSWPLPLHHVPWASVHLAGKSRMCVWGSVGRRDSYRQLEVVLRQLQVFWSAAEVLEVSCFRFMSVDQGTLIWVSMCRSEKKKTCFHDLERHRYLSVLWHKMCECSC